MALTSRFSPALAQARGGACPTGLAVRDRILGVKPRALGGEALALEAVRQSCGSVGRMVECGTSLS